MPRRRKAARGFQRPVRASVAEMRRRFDTPAARFFAEFEFFTALPTPREREAYLEAFPETYKHFGFEDSDLLKYRNVVGHGFPFRRQDFTAFLEQHPARVPFDPPDLRGVRYRDHERILCRARANWWKANDWPMTPEERAWLRSSDSIPRTNAPVLEMHSIGERTR